MAGVPECGICSHAYDERDRKPRVLQCGHTYCQPCLQGVVSQGSPACPSCRRDIVSPVAQLPVNFMLLLASESDGAASKNGAGKDLPCGSHQKELDFWCRECNILICKLCLVKTHRGHNFTVVEEVFADEEILIEKRNQARKDLQDVNFSIKTLQQLKSLANKIDQLKATPLEKILFNKRSDFHRNLNMLKKISPESPFMEKHAVLECLRNDSQTLSRIDVSDLLRQVDGWIAYCRANNYMPTDYMPNGTPWKIFTGEAADRALRTTRETDHTTPKAIVRSTDESPILCLFELLQYLAVSSQAMELELMDTVEREWSDEKEWFPLQTGGDKSTDEWHCSRLRALARAWRDLPAVAPASGAGPGKVVAIVDCYTRTRDVGVLAVGKVAKRDDGSWPLPLEVHLLGHNNTDPSWLERCLWSLYTSAQPSLGECRVYVPGEALYSSPGDLFPLLAELGTKYSTQHRLYLDSTFQRNLDDLCRQLSAEHKIPYEWKDI